MSRLLLNPWVLLAGVVAITGAVGGAYFKGRADGRALEQAAIVQQINRENREAGDAAEKWRHDLRRCNDAGGVFSFDTGACQH